MNLLLDNNNNFFFESACSVNILTKNRSQLQNNNFFCSGIINLLFDGLAEKKADILLVAKPSNKVYVLFVLVTPNHLPQRFLEQQW